MCVFFSHKKGSKKTGLTPTSNFPGGPLEEAQTRVPTCHICHVCHICLCHVGFSNFTEVLAQSCCKTFKASKSSKYSKRYFQQRLPWFRWYADIRRYAPCPTFVDCSRPDLFSSFRSNGITHSIFSIREMYRGIGGSPDTAGSLRRMQKWFLCVAGGSAAGEALGSNVS